MKKRIIASTMASVMALSAGTSLMASAAVADYKDASVNKQTLRKLIEDQEIVDLVENDGLSQYGSKSGANFLKAYDYAKAVLDDVDAGNDQATVAYLMVKATKGALKQYTSDDLKILVESLRGIRNTNNELNDRGDAIYEDEPWSKFVSAFDTADDYKEYDDILVTTDAWEDLDAVKNPKKLETRTKIQIDTARANYEKALQLEYKYQPWIRGTVSAAKTDYDGYGFAWGILYQHVKSANADLKNTYDSFDKIKGLSITSDPEIVAATKAMETAAAVLNGFSASYENGSSSSSVNRLLAQYHGQLVYTYNADFAADILNAYIAKATNAGGAVKVKSENKFTESYSVATTNNAAKNQYWNVKISGQADSKPLGSNAYSEVANSKTETGKNVQKLISAEMVVHATSAAADVYFIADANNKLPNNNGVIWTPLVDDASVDDLFSAGDYFFASESIAKAAIKTAASNQQANMQVKVIKKDSDYNLSQYMPVTATNVTNVLLAGLSVSDTNLDAAATDVKTYVTGVKTALATLKSAVTTADDKAGKATVDNDNAATSARATALTTAEKTTLTAATAKLVEDFTKLETLISNMDAASASNVGLKEYIADFKTVATMTSTILNDIKSVTSALPTGYTADSASYTDLTDKAYASGKTDADEMSDWTAAQLARFVKDTATNGSPSALGEAFETEYSRRIGEMSSTLIGKVYAATTGNNYSKDANHANNYVDVYNEIEAFKSDKGLQFKDPSVFTFSAYSTTRDAGSKSSDTTPSLVKAMIMLEEYNAKNWTGVNTLDNANYVSGDKRDNSNPTSRAWQVLYTYLKYALEDEFVASAEATYTLKDVKDLLDKSYKLATETVETSLFNVSHMLLYIDRNAASEWVKKAEGSATGEAYKNNDTTYEVTATDIGSSKDMNAVKPQEFNSTTMYNKLNDQYKQLNDELSAFKYSFGDIITKMAAIADAVDKGTFDAKTAEDLNKQLLDTALAFVKVEAVMPSSGSALDDSELFNADGTINIHNRLFTNGSEFNGLKLDTSVNNSKTKIARSNKAGDKNETHYNMQVAYEKLVETYETALNGPDKNITTDVNGDGVFTVADISALLKLFVDNTYDVNKHDFTGDGKVTVDDIIYLVKELIK